MSKQVAQGLYTQKRVASRHASHTTHAKIHIDCAERTTSGAKPRPLLTRLLCTCGAPTTKTLALKCVPARSYPHELLPPRLRLASPVSAAC